MRREVATSGVRWAGQSPVTRVWVYYTLHSPRARRTYAPQTHDSLQGGESRIRVLGAREAKQRVVSLPMLLITMEPQEQ